MTIAIFLLFLSLIFYIFISLFKLRQELNVIRQKIDYIIEADLSEASIVKAILSEKYEYLENRQPKNLWYKKIEFKANEIKGEKIIEFLNIYNKKVRFQWVLIILFGMLLLGLMLVAQFLSTEPISIY